MATVPVSDGPPGHLGRPLEWLRDGWHALRDRAASSLTWFEPGQAADRDDAGAAAPRWGLVACDVVEAADEVRVELEIPGMDRSDLRVDVIGDVLVVSGEKRLRNTRHEHGMVITERAFGRFERSIPLPARVRREAAGARYTDGVLTVTLPKADGGARKIAVERG